MDIGKKIGKYMNIRMGLTMSIIMSIVGSFIGVKAASKNSEVPFIKMWIPSLLVSLVLAACIALIIGSIINMKKFNDGIEKVTKLKGFALHVVQSIITNLVYAAIIGFIMALVSTAVFALPNQKKGMEAEIKGLEAQKTALEGQIAEIQAKGPDMTEEDQGKLASLNGELGPIDGKIGGMKESLSKLSLVPTAAKNFARSFPFEFIFATIVVIIVQPIFMKKALAKYVPGYGEEVAGDAEI